MKRDVKPKSSQIGKLPPRYDFILNPHTGTRLSKCPQCEKLTYPRKFAFMIHIDKWGPLTFGKTSKYCSRCELIMVHQDELEAELAFTFENLAPGMIGNEYMVLGTVDKEVWSAGVHGEKLSLDDLMSHMADFKETFGLEFDPGGWFFDGETRA